jgi:hypothetical protein
LERKDKSTALGGWCSRPSETKVSPRSYLKNKSSVVTYAYNPSYLGGRVERIISEAFQGKSTRPYIKSKPKAKGLEYHSSGRVLASQMQDPEDQSPVLPINK